MAGVTVLGASGFLGSAVGRRLVAAGGPVRLVGRTFPPGLTRLADHTAEVEVWSLDLREPDAVERAVGDSTAVVSLVADFGGADSWRREADADAESVDLGVLERVVGHLRTTALAQPAALVFASTAALSRAAPDAERTSYELCKRRGEDLLNTATIDGVVRGTSLRLSSLVGVGKCESEPGAGSVRAFAEQALAGQPIGLWASGDVRRNLLHIEDAAAAVVAALDHLDRLAGRAWDVGAVDGVSLAEIAGLVTRTTARVTGCPPVSVTRVAPPIRVTAHDLTDCVLDTRGFRAATGWKPRHGLVTAIEDTVLALADRPMIAR